MAESKNLTTSKVDRQNILNNSLAVEEIEKLKHIYKPPVEMQEKWDEAHKHYVEKYAWIKTMHSM